MRWDSKKEGGATKGGAPGRVVMPSRWWGTSNEGVLSEGGVLSRVG